MSFILLVQSEASRFDIGITMRNYKYASTIALALIIITVACNIYNTIMNKIQVKISVKKIMIYISCVVFAYIMDQLVGLSVSALRHGEIVMILFRSFHILCMIITGAIIISYFGINATKNVYIGYVCLALASASLIFKIITILFSINFDNAAVNFLMANYFYGYWYFYLTGAIFFIGIRAVYQKKHIAPMNNV